MSWLQRNFLSNIYYKRNHIYGLFWNEIRLQQRGCFTCSCNTHKSQLLQFRSNTLGKHRYSVAETARDLQDNVGKFMREFSKTWTTYIPLFGTIKYKMYGKWWFKTLDEINVVEFITLFNMPDTYFSRFHIIILHVWMLLYNMPDNGRIDTLIKHAVVESMWIDGEKRGKIIYDKGTGLRKDLVQLNNRFKVTLLLYDEACRNDADLSNALWYNFFEKTDIDPRVLEALVEYIRHQMEKLKKLNFKALHSDQDKSGIWISPEPFIKKHLKS